MVLLLRLQKMVLYKVVEPLLFTNRVVELV
nr:MAG TPA: hypothetical protein [Caudoviricetes sp.]DAG95703.1 MAG TPA: hypothetical protein [Crassvirales sp.]